MPRCGACAAAGGCWADAPVARTSVQRTRTEVMIRIGVLPLVRSRGRWCLFLLGERCVVALLHVVDPRFVARGINVGVRRAPKPLVLARQIKEPAVRAEEDVNRQ